MRHQSFFSVLHILWYYWLYYDIFKEFFSIFSMGFNVKRPSLLVRIKQKFFPVSKQSDRQKHLPHIRSVSPYSPLVAAANTISTGRSALILSNYCHCYCVYAKIVHILTYWVVWYYLLGFIYTMIYHLLETCCKKA